MAATSEALIVEAQWGKNMETSKIYIEALYRSIISPVQNLSRYRTAFYPFFLSFFASTL